MYLPFQDDKSSGVIDVELKPNQEVYFVEADENQIEAIMLEPNSDEDEELMDTDEMASALD